MLLPQEMRGWLPEDHLAHFVSDVVDELDLSAVMAAQPSGRLRKRREAGRCIYSKRKEVVEPVSGQIKEARG